MSDKPIAIVTGASRGIGAAVAIELARLGYDLVLAASNGDAVNAVAEQTRSTGAKAIAATGDLADLDFAKSIIDRGVKEFGRIDLLVNNAAWRELVTMREISAESWDRTLRICLTTPAFLAKWAAEQMEPHGHGVIINVSSIMATLTSGVAPAYVAAKGGLDTLTRDLAVLYGPHGIRVVGISPGAIDTDLGNDRELSVDPKNAVDPIKAYGPEIIPLRRWGTADETAKAIAFLASDDASYISGTTLVMDGGWQAHLEPYSLTRLSQPGQFPP